MWPRKTLVTLSLYRTNLGSYPHTKTASPEISKPCEDPQGLIISLKIGALRKTGREGLLKSPLPSSEEYSMDSFYVGAGIAH